MRICISTIAGGNCDVYISYCVAMMSCAVLSGAVWQEEEEEFPRTEEALVQVCTAAT
jgi:hypothetical protein